MTFQGWTLILLFVALVVAMAKPMGCGSACKKDPVSGVIGV